MDGGSDTLLTLGLEEDRVGAGGGVRLAALAAVHPSTRRPTLPKIDFDGPRPNKLARYYDCMQRPPYLSATAIEVRL